MKAVISGVLSHYGMDTPTSQGSPTYWPGDSCNQSIYQQNYNSNNNQAYSYDYSSAHYYRGADCIYNQSQYQYNGYSGNDYNYAYSGQNYFVPSSQPGSTSENSSEGYLWDGVS